jgi:hypothetical protein
VIAALYVRADSIYKQMPGVDAWDAERDAQRWPEGCPVIAHPPCAQWGQLAFLANDKPEEKRLAMLAVGQVRRNGGVLEHPKRSALWEAMNLPAPGDAPDSYGGWTLGVSQFWWGHRADKQTLLYIVGCAPADVPDIPYVMGDAPCVVEVACKQKDGTRSKRRPAITKAEREHTPPQFAQWLVDLAKRCRPN